MDYRDYAVSEVEKQAIDAWIETGSNRAAAEKLGKSKTAVQEAVKRVKDRAALQGYSPDHDMYHTAPDSHIVKGTSTLYKDGVPSIQWVKTNVKLESQLESIKAYAEALTEDLPKVKPRNTSGEYKDMLAVYPMGDPHIGLLCWHEETGDSHDLDIGVTELCAAVDRLVNTAPKCKHALIANLGDFFHADTMDNKTWRSGHNLDVDGRWMKILRAGIKAMRQCIDSALDHHETVTVINAIGNHDDHSSMFLSVALSNIYENEPRVTINDSPTSTHYYRFGKSLIGVHHGHNIKAGELPLVMASERKSDWGETDHHAWYTGHIHHDTAKDYTGCTVETFRTLAARDAYAASHGYLSLRDMKCIVHHKEFGEIERHTVSVPMLRSGVAR